MRYILLKSKEIPNKDDLKRKCEKLEPVSIDNVLFFFEVEQKNAQCLKQDVESKESFCCSLFCLY